MIEPLKSLRDKINEETDAKIRKMEAKADKIGEEIKRVPRKKKVEKGVKPTSKESKKKKKNEKYHKKQ